MAMVMPAAKPVSSSSSSSSILQLAYVESFPNTWEHNSDKNNRGLPAYTPYSYKYYGNLPMDFVCSHLMDKARIKFDTPDINFIEAKTAEAMKIVTRMCFFLSYGAPNRMYIFTY